jgi:hypothetical protein
MKNWILSKFFEDFLKMVLRNADAIEKKARKEIQVRVFSIYTSS